MRILLAVAALFLLATFAPPSFYAPEPLPAHPRIWARPVPLDAASPGRRQLGALRFLAGWELTSDDRRFGGISAIHVSADGRVLALSDAGSVIRFAVPDGKDVVGVRIDPLPDGPGPADRKSNRDSESMAIHGKTIWAGFESRNAVWRYGLAPLRGERGAFPRAMRDWPGTGGSEAMLRLKDGRFLVFSERARQRDGTTEVLLFDRDPTLPDAKAINLSYRAPEGYHVTDAAWLPDGRMLLLNRRFSILDGLTAKLLIANRPKLEEGTIIEGREIADFHAPITVDNMEALSVTRAQGRTIVWIASDDNFNPLQRTLLLKFALVGG